MEGRVKFYNRQKGFGFIANGDGPDIYFSREDLLVKDARIHKSDVISFDVYCGAEGKLRARRVRPVGTIHEQPRYVMT